MVVGSVPIMTGRAIPSLRDIPRRHRIAARRARWRCTCEPGGANDQHSGGRCVAFGNALSGTHCGQTAVSGEHHR